LNFAGVIELFLIWRAPTLPAGRLAAAQPVPPKATNNASNAIAFDLTYLRAVIMRRVSFSDQLSGDEPGPRVPELPKADCLLDEELWLVEPPPDEEHAHVGVLDDCEAGGEL
jgi:hypothetical protein